MKHKKTDDSKIKKDKKHHHFILKISIVIIVLIFLVFKFSNIANNSIHHQQAKEYFENNEHNATIQEFMHLRMIAKEFEIEKEDAEKIIGFKIHPRDTTRPLKEVCESKSLNCEQIISELNKISKRDENYNKEEKNKNK